MEKERNTVGLSRDYIIHPGETIEEVLEDREMTQRELSIRTGVTEKHISTVIHGQKNISASFAKKLEYALGIEASFWMNLQAVYDRELLEFEELNGITEIETGILSDLKDVIEKWDAFGWIDKNANKVAQVLDLRSLLNISDLTNIPKIAYHGAYRVQKDNQNINPYVLFAWQRMCELLTINTDVADELNVEKLKEAIPEIKKTMFLDVNSVQKRLTSIFSECGIAFCIVPNFTGAPVQGFIKKTDGRLILCITLRQKFADIFWFTLFHEIAHILNGDTDNVFIDITSVSNKMEKAADELAATMLINDKDYQQFVGCEGYRNAATIDNFARSQNVREYIVRGRLMRDGYIPWRNRLKYDWA